MNGIPQNVVDDDRIPQRFVPQRPRRLPDLSKDPRVPLRFLKQKSSSEYKCKENIPNKEIHDDNEGDEAVEAKPGEHKISQPWRRTNPRTINLSIKQLMTLLVEKVDDENKENEDKNSENVSIFDTLYK